MKTIHWAFVRIRDACAAGNTPMAFDIADAFEPLGLALMDREKQAQNLERFEVDCLEPLVAKYPDLARLLLLWRDQAATK
jgi:hypothetical protein